MYQSLEGRAYAALDSLRTRLPLIREAVEPGSRRRWTQRDVSPEHMARLDEIARQERKDRSVNIAAGITALGASPAPLRLEVLDAERAILEGLAELEATVCEWLILTPLTGARPAEVITRLIAVLDRIAQAPELADWVLDEARRLNRMAGATIGDVEAVQRLDARCPVCDALSLRVLMDRGLVACANPDCRCREPECPCVLGLRHLWTFERWPELAEQLAATG